MFKDNEEFEQLLGSPSSRRAWIEIVAGISYLKAVQVALLAEGVDRNHHSSNGSATILCRPPRGGRG